MRTVPIKREAREPAEAPKLRQWVWPEMRPYNGFSHAERVRGWQLVSLLLDLGQIERPVKCSISGADHGIQFHLENYYSWTPYPITRTLHFALHSRFKFPERWLRVVEAYSTTGNEWFATLPVQPHDLATDLRREFGQGVSDIFGRVRLPTGVVISPREVFRDNSSPKTSC